MELAPRYCRTCGSRILVKNICHNCNNEPLKGDNYCYNCGALTPNANACLKCGAKYNKASPLKPIIIFSIIIIAISVAAYFISTSGNTQKISQQEDSSKTPATTQAPPENPAAQNPIINPVDTTQKPIVAPADTATSKTNIYSDTATIKNPPVDSTKLIKPEPELFSSEDLKAYNIRCTYFKKNARSQILFFIAAGKGYIKLNGEIYELKKKHKGVDEESFSGLDFEATIIIEGLSGSAKEWLASCTLIIKNLSQKTSTKHTVYSSCIEL